jgi:DNA-directed RNA polymerase specialized sigma24 family protein
MDEHEFLSEQFEENRAHLRSVANRMLGSLSETEDALQEIWLHLSRSDSSDIENLSGWLTTVTARVCPGQRRSGGARSALVRMSAWNIRVSERLSLPAC